MDLATIVADAGYVLGLGQLAIQTAQDITPFFQAAYNIVVNKQALTTDQRAALLVQEQALRDLLNQDTIPSDVS